MPRAIQPGFGEGSGLRSVRDSDALAQLPKKTNTNVEQDIRNSEVIRRLMRVVQKLQKRQGGGVVGGVSGWQWQTPAKELNGTIAVSKDTVVYISPGNPIVTVGAVDLVSGQLTKSVAGIWIAAKDVPADNGSGYNVPQLPYPGATGAVSGTPLKGDVDGANVFWILISMAPVCTT